MKNLPAFQPTAQRGSEPPRGRLSGVGGSFKFPSLSFSHLEIEEGACIFTGLFCLLNEIIPTKADIEANFKLLLM